jgi:hypothetical protein
MIIPAKGRIEVYRVFDETDWLKVGECHNNILYAGYDAMAKALAGDATYTITGMYLEYKNGVPSQPVIPMDRTTQYYFDLVAPYGFVRLRTLSNPTYSTSDAAKYSHNVVTFLGVTDGTSAGGAPIIDGTSQFFSLALVAIPNIDDRREDHMVSAAALMNGAVFAPVTKQANSQLGFRWSLQLGS